MPSSGSCAVATDGVLAGAVATDGILAGAVATDGVLAGAVATDGVLAGAAATDGVLAGAAATDRVLAGAVAAAVREDVFETAPSWTAPPLKEDWPLLLRSAPHAAHEVTLSL